MKLDVSPCFHNQPPPPPGHAGKHKELHKNVFFLVCVLGGEGGGGVRGGGGIKSKDCDKKLDIAPYIYVIL